MLPILVVVALYIYIYMYICFLSKLHASKPKPKNCIGVVPVCFFVPLLWHFSGESRGRPQLQPWRRCCTAPTSSRPRRFCLLAQRTTGGWVVFTKRWLFFGCSFKTTAKGQKTLPVGLHENLALAVIRNSHLARTVGWPAHGDAGLGMFGACTPAATEHSGMNTVLSAGFVLLASITVELGVFLRIPAARENAVLNQPKRRGGSNTP